MTFNKKRILITGASGFIGKNLRLKLLEDPHLEVKSFTRDTDIKLKECIFYADTIVHLAGVNRPNDEWEFEKDNVDLTRKICALILEKYRLKNEKTRIILASSYQATNNTVYGQSKGKAERLVIELNDKLENVGIIFRLPGVFGKFCKPNYNSVVATFCYNIINGIPLLVSDRKKKLNLAYIDDVAEEFEAAIKIENPNSIYEKVNATYELSIGQLAKKISDFHKDRSSLQVAKVGNGLDRALYATYLSYQPPTEFSYKLKNNIDHRGNFAEILKTKDGGQVSIFTSAPGITRGNHYHNTKSEKFLVVSGEALFEFKNIADGRDYKKTSTSSNYEIIETIPGWAHKITNVGESELTVLVWANEVFDKARPDTIKMDF